MDRAYLQWNLVNWITVVLMVMLGLAVVGFVQSGIKTYQANNGKA